MLDCASIPKEQTEFSSLHRQTSFSGALYTYEVLTHSHSEPNQETHIYKLTALHIVNYWEADKQKVLSVKEDILTALFAFTFPFGSCFVLLIFIPSENKRRGKKDW